jgi:hypothetical protein
MDKSSLKDDDSSSLLDAGIFTVGRAFSPLLAEQESKSKSQVTRNRLAVCG